MLQCIISVFSALPYTIKLSYSFTFSKTGQKFPEALEDFMKLFEQLDNRMSTIVLKAFLMSGTTLGAFKVSETTKNILCPI